MTAPALFCERIGTGPDLVMLHGWGMNAGIWGDCVKALAAHFRLHMFDLPGHGRSASIEPFALDTVCEALARQAPERADWLGWSLGGAVALEFAARFPERVSHLILVASNPRFAVADDWPHAMAPALLEQFARDLTVDSTATINRFLSLVARGAPDAAVLRELRRVVAAAPRPTVAALQGGLSILRDADLRERLRALRVPVLCIGGERDMLVPIAALRELAAELPQLQLREFPRAGHAPFLSRPEQFAVAVTEFLQ